MTSNEGAILSSVSIMIVCHTSGSGLFASSRRPLWTTDTRLADVTESPLANSVTAWPISTSASVR
jgi:hypothetical protein